MTGPASPALLLPRAEALTSEMLVGEASIVSDAALADLRRSLRLRLIELVAPLPAGERLTLDTYRLKMALDHPETCGRQDDAFVPSARTCRRAVGLAAVQRCVRAYSPAPAPAVTSVLRDGIDGDDPEGDVGRPPWWAKWYGSLSPGGRAVVAAEAVTFATQLWTALEWGRFAHPPIIGGRDDWWDCPDSRQLTFKGRVDVRASADGRPVMAVVHAGAPGAGWLPLVGFPALVAGMARGGKALPSRVVGLWPASGQVRILPVDEAVLRSTADVACAAVGAWVEGRLQLQSP